MPLYRCIKSRTIVSAPKGTLACGQAWRTSQCGGDVAKKHSVGLKRPDCHHSVPAVHSTSMHHFFHVAHPWKSICLFPEEGGGCIEAFHRNARRHCTLTGPSQSYMQRKRLLPCSNVPDLSPSLYGHMKGILIEFMS